jgi:general secretion pathway protein G
MHRMNSFARAARRQSGFSLIEILIVVVLIAGIMGLVASQVFGNKDRADYRLAQTQIQTLGAKVESFVMDVGTAPNSLSDLVRQPSGASGWLGPYAREGDIKDPWGREFQYSADGNSFNLTSLGKDGKPGGQSYDADIKYGDE